jgi:hypothetical protein
VRVPEDVHLAGFGLDLDLDLGLTGLVGGGLGLELVLSPGVVGTVVFDDTSGAVAESSSS